MSYTTLSVPAAAVNERHRTRFILISSGVGALLLTVFAVWFPGWLSASIWAYGLSLTYLVFALVTRDALLLRFLFFGMLAGWIELLPDHWLVSGTGTLVYAPDEPIVDSSPLYMPFSWMAVFVQVGYVGWLLSKRVPMITAMLIVGALGALIIPFYEFISIHGGWWAYRDTPMILTVPYYIILAEGLLMASIPPMFRACERGPLWRIPLLAFLQGLLMWGSVFVSYELVG